MEEHDIGALQTAVFASFVDESLGQCEDCYWPTDCYRCFVLDDAGVVRPCPDLEGVDAWAVWSQCPRHYEFRYLIDQGIGSAAELARWAWECDDHKRPITARASHLIRTWTRIKDLPSALREHIVAKKLKSNKNAG